MTTPTPITDAVETKHGLAWFGLHDEQGRYLDGMIKFRELARQLERDLAAAQEENAKLKAEITRVMQAAANGGYCRRNHADRDEIKQLERERDEARRAAERIWAAAVEVIDAERKWSYSQPTIQALRELEAAIAEGK